jgi:hypothetical protein
MIRPVQRPRDHRPILEPLERRELPSGVGAFLYFATLPLPGQANTVNNDLQSLKTAQQTLSADISHLKLLAIPGDYIQAGNAFNQLKTDAQTLQNSINTDTLYVFLAAGAGNLDASDYFFGSIAINTIIQGQQTYNDAKSQGNNLIAMAEPLGFASIQTNQNLTPI